MSMFLQPPENAEEPLSPVSAPLPFGAIRVNSLMSRPIKGKTSGMFYADRKSNLPLAMLADEDCDLAIVRVSDLLSAAATPKAECLPSFETLKKLEPLLADVSSRITGFHCAVKVTLDEMKATYTEPAEEPDDVPDGSSDDIGVADPDENSRD